MRRIGAKWPVLVVPVWAAILGTGSGGTARAAGAALGQEIRLTTQEPLTPDSLLSGGTAENPYTSRLSLSADWILDATPEKTAALEALLGRTAAAHHRLLVSVEGAAPAQPEERARWLDGLRRLASLGGERLLAIEPIRVGENNLRIDEEAFLFKQAAVVIRSARRGFLVALGVDVSPETAARLEALYSEEFEPYVDAWALHASPERPPPSSEEVQTLQTRRLTLDPGASLWVVGLPAGRAGPDSEAALYGRFAVAGVEAAVFEPSPASLPLLSFLHSRIDAGYAPMPAGGVGFLDASGASTPAYGAWRLFNPETSKVQMIVVPAGAPAEPFFVVVDTFDVTAPSLYDAATGAGPYVVGVASDRAGNRATLSLPGLRGPALVEYKRFVAPGSGREALEVGGARTPSVEEIIARYQEARAAGEAAVKTILADTTISVHYAVAGTGMQIDFTYHSGFSWDRDSGGEFEHREMLVNGSRWTREKLPELPLIQPEKVVTVPLELNLSKQYLYVLRGREDVDGRPAWRVEFLPVDPAATRYSGTIWIDRETYRRLRLQVVQTGLDPPVLSSEEVERFGSYPVPEGGTADLVREIRGQQLWNVVGASFVVNREVVFDAVRINDPSFAEVRASAHASSHQILRDTEHGFRYLVKNESGERVVQDKPGTRSRFLLGGVFQNEALDYPVPLAGLNLYDSDFRRRGQQINLFLAGLANFATWSDPALGKTRVDASATLGLIGFAGADRDFVAGEERKEAEVKTREQSFSATVGFPLGKYVRLRGRYGLTYDNFQLGEDTKAGFVVPDDTFTHQIGSEVQFNRRGFSAVASSGMFFRDSWSPWGDPDPASTLLGSRVGDFSDRTRDYFRSSLVVSQDLFLKAFQKARLEAAWVDGSDLDRFSQYQFAFFGGETRLAGFSGSGVRFDRGALARARYTFNLAGLVSFDVRLEHARVQPPFTNRTDQDHTGIGINGKWVGPWGLIMQIDYGYALRSDIEALEGEQEFEFLLLRVF